MLFGVGVSCHILYSIVSYLNVSCSGLITSIGEERANLSAIVYLQLYVVSVWKGFLFLWILGMGCVFLLALTGPSIYLLSNLEMCIIMHPTTNVDFFY